VTNEENDSAARAERLEKRLAREREARQELERLAEHGMRNLWDINKNLEARVAERTVDLERSLASTMMASDAKERFLAELGHEMTTPMHAVLGLLELIDPEGLSATDQGRFGQIRDHVDQCSGLFRGLIDLAGAEGASDPQTFEGRRPFVWLDDLIGLWTRDAAASGQLIIPTVKGDHAEVVLDWNRLTRIVDALLSNAVRHASPGVIGVEIIVVADDAQVTVTDDGPGMSPAELDAACAPFIKYSSAGGVGIGLSIAQRLAASGGGSLELKNDEATTQARVHLPRGRRVGGFTGLHQPGSSPAAPR
jgi:two-component system sensor histidine kinase EvgS